MKEHKRIGTFFGGFVTALALTACLTTALAASGTVSYNFANVALDGQQKITAGQDITAAPAPSSTPTRREGRPTICPSAPSASCWRNM